MRPIAVVALDHVGIAAHTPDGHALASLLGPAIGLGIEMPSGVAIARFGPSNKLELVWPNAAGSPIERFLQRRGPGAHHLALEVVGPLQTVVLQLDSLGVATTGPIEPSADGRPSVFLHPSSTGGVLVELVEGGPTG